MFVFHVVLIKLGKYATGMREGKDYIQTFLTQLINDLFLCPANANIWIYMLLKKNLNDSWMLDKITQ